MNQHIQTLKRFNAWLAGEDVIDLPAPSAVIEAINQLLEHVAEIESLRDQLGIAKKDWLN
jgi:hypothetical protein